MPHQPLCAAGQMRHFIQGRLKTFSASEGFLERQTRIRAERADLERLVGFRIDFQIDDEDGGDLSV